MNELVVGIDGSDHSRMALRWGAAAAAGVPVRAVQSWTHPRRAVLPVASVPVPSEEMDEQSRQAVGEVVTDTLGSSAGVATAVSRGPAAGALPEAVNPDSVLELGWRGRGGLAGLMLGSVRLHAVYAWRATVSERRPRMGDRLQSRAAAAVGGWTQQVSDDVETDQLEGDPREVLVTTAERIAPAVVVVGRRGAGGLRSMRLGSTANHLVRHATTNVAVVPDPGLEPVS